MLPPYKRFDNLFPLGVNPNANDTQYCPALFLSLNHFPVGAPYRGFSVPPMASVAPSLFTPKSSHFYLRYQQHGHAQDLTKEESLGLKLFS